jgi:hypothetical protein
VAATAALAQSESKAAPSAALVLSNVRKAINYRKLKELKSGFVIEEAGAAGGSDTRLLWLGSSGEFKQESKLLTTNHSALMESSAGKLIGPDCLRQCHNGSARNFLFRLGSEAAGGSTTPRLSSSQSCLKKQTVSRLRSP